MFAINVEGAVVKGSKWLVIERGVEEEHAAGTLAFVGGTVENEGFSQDILERTVRREIFEEVGIEIQEKLHFVYSSSFMTEEGIPVINVVFLCEYAQGTPYRKSENEVEAVYWMTTEEISDHPKSPPWTIESARRADQMLKQLQAEHL
ncbi:NUDIX domain-containing protein [Paenibacillus sp.]|uniref:NUDIX hydrolase n=1 Tax=Paenibacillus sp. TaxID=58172 RepID=UPI00282CC7D4|nr:NUDIX domain-containing protein [Paenibacillus sp.]MDR0270655.1 NUDIX domain-containing protein [Paenibacillus sp.]